MKSNAAFDPGFRISEWDVGFMILVLLSSAYLARLFEQLALAALFAVLHFFFFCNVLRAKRLLELLWAVTFVGLWLSSYLREVPTWPHTYVLALAVTIFITVLQVLLPSYHGAFWSILNPRLPQWWKRNGGGD